MPLLCHERHFFRLPCASEPFAASDRDYERLAAIHDRQFAGHLSCQGHGSSETLLLLSGILLLRILAGILALLCFKRERILVWSPGDEFKIIATIIIFVAIYV